MSSIPQPTGMDFSVAAVVQTVHSAVVANTYAGKCKAHLGTIASLALPLQKYIRQILQQALQSTSAEDVDWEAHAFKCVIADFKLNEDLGIEVGDTEYVVLLATVVILAFEVSVLPEVSYMRSTSAFLMSAVEQYFCEPEVYLAMATRIEEEQHRLVRAGADIQVLQAVAALRRLMPTSLNRNGTWNKLRSAVKNRPSIESVESVASCQAQVDMDFAGAAGSLPPQSPCLTTFPRYVHIVIFLKADRSIDFDFVDSIHESEGKMIVKSCVGPRMHVEPEYEASSVHGTHDTVTLRARSGSDGVKQFAATVIVPPGNLYHVTDVEYESEMARDLSQTIIETDAAVMNVSNGLFTIQRRDQRRSRLVENTELKL